VTTSAPVRGARPGGSGVPGEPPGRQSRPAGPGERRRWRFPLLVGLAVVVAAALATVVGGGSSGDLDPASGSRAGSRAVTRILERQGVLVTRTGDPAAARAERGTLVLVRPDLLPTDQLPGLTSGAARVVLVEPGQDTLDAVAPGVRLRGTAPAATADPACAAPDAGAGPARAGGQGYAVAARQRVDLCFPHPGGGAWSLVEVDGAGRAGTATVVVLGQGDVLRNGHLADDADAALALRVLGHDRTVTWLVPDPATVPASGPTTVRDLLPPWVGWVVLQLAVVVSLTLVWRGRRLGPLVREPLPVVVQAGETLQGRARLYRRARAVDRTAATLRTAVLRRLAARLAVRPDAAPDAVAVRVADATGQDLQGVRHVLLGPPPRDERELVRLADALDAVERDVSPGSSGDQGERRR